jgi:hypothetical protein
MRQYKFLLVIFFVILFCRSQAADYQLFIPDFLIYDEDTKSYVPSPYFNVDGKIASFIYTEGNLVITGREDFDVFLNQKYTQSISEGDTFKLIYSNIVNAQKPLLITIKSKISIKNLQFLSGINQGIKSELVLRAPTFLEIRATKTSLYNRYLLGLCIILFFIVVLKFNIPEIGKYIIGIFKPGSFNSRGALLRKEGLLIIIFLAVLFFTMTYVLTPYSIDKQSYSYVDNVKMLSKILFFLIGISLINIAFHFTIGGLYKISKLSRTYSIELLFLLMVITLVTLPLYLLLFTPFVNIPTMGSQVFKYSIFFLFSLIFLNELYFFYIRHRMKKIYFITYICICDLIPFLIIFKLVQDLSFA